MKDICLFGIVLLIIINPIFSASHDKNESKKNDFEHLIPMAHLHYHAINHLRDLLWTTFEECKDRVGIEWAECEDQDGRKWIDDFRKSYPDPNPYWHQTTQGIVLECSHDNYPVALYTPFGRIALISSHKRKGPKQESCSITDVFLQKISVNRLEHDKRYPILYSVRSYTDQKKEAISLPAAKLRTDNFINAMTIDEMWHTFAKEDHETKSIR